MADLRSWYTGQLVTAQEMRGGDTALEQGIYDLATDAGFVGLISGGSVAEHAGTPNLTVDVAALLARSPLGERIRVAGTAIVDCEYDYLTQPTAVTTPGNSRFVDVYVVFDRLGSDPRLDATNTTVYFIQSESFAFEVYQGAEAVSPVAPAGPSDGVLLARITLTFGQTTIETADIDLTVKDSVVKLDQSGILIEAGTFTEALDLFLAEYAGHVSGSGAHPATAITYGGGGNWANGGTNPSTTVELQLDKVISDLAATTSGQSGLHRIGIANSSSWADGTSYTSGTAFSVVDGIIVSLAGTAGAGKIGIAARTAWLGGRTNPAITSGGGIYAAVDKIITDLAATNSTDDGAERIGAQATGALASGSVRSQLNELDARLTYSRSSSLSTLSGGAGSISPIDKTHYRLDGTGGGTFTIAAPSSALGPTPRVRFVFENGSGDETFVRYSSTDVVKFTGANSGVADGYLCWAELEWTGSTWVTSAWGTSGGTNLKVVPLVY